MKTLPTLLCMALFFAALIALVQQIPAPQDPHHRLAVDETEARNLAEFPCTTQKTLLQREMVAINSCWDNSECFAGRLGYPWQQHPCEYQLFSSSESQRNAALQEEMARYLDQCGRADADFALQLQAYEAKASLARCQDLRQIKLVCISGKCANQTQALMQFGDEGVDKYGSRDVINMPGAATSE